jgi:FAD/FMN-containing dehydrogenase
VLSRRQFLELAAIATLSPAACLSTRRTSGVAVNDIHSQLNETIVSDVLTPQSVGELAAILRRTRGPIALSGSRHAMGGQQFAGGETLIDIRRMDRVLSFDHEKGVIEIESGIQWPSLMEHTRQEGGRWGITQKQTGADRLTLGGSLAANVHGRGLTMKPIVGDVESFILLDPAGNPIECNRTKNSELFGHAIGGYGLFGAIASLRLRLVPRRKVRRVVEVLTIDQLMAAFERRIASGFLYGDFQFSIDELSSGFLHEGVFSCYEPVDDETPMAESQAELQPADWMRLLLLAHADKRQAFERYAGYYLATGGQIYWSDEHQLSYYPDNYHREIDTLLRTRRGTEMITELYVPRPRLAEFMSAAAEELRRLRANVIYGTVRLIQRDEETVLAWAKQPYACIIFNLHVEHGDAGIAAAAEQFRALIDIALVRDGSYFLTYHRWARRDQVERAYPQLQAFLEEKRRFDPAERFTSNWYRHYATMFE